MLIPFSHQSVILGYFLPQDDATLKCWGLNDSGQLGLGESSNRGGAANGPCPPSSTTVTQAGPTSSDCCSCFSRAEMGAKLPSIDLGLGRTAVAVVAGGKHTCALLVSSPIGRL